MIHKEYVYNKEIKLVRFGSMECLVCNRLSFFIHVAHSSLYLEDNISSFGFNSNVSMGLNLMKTYVVGISKGQPFKALLLHCIHSLYA